MQNSPDLKKREKVFRLITATVFPVIILALLEAGLHIAGYGYPPGFFIKSRINNQDVYVENQRYTFRFFSKDLARPIDTLIVPAKKSPGTTRIFVLGESAARGDPDPSFSFSRVLEKMLCSRYPDRHFEVYNTAITAINSNVVVHIAQDCAKLQPDVFIVLLGNNEVVGPFGPGSVFSPSLHSLFLIRVRTMLGSTRTGQLLNDLTQKLTGKGKIPGAWGGMEMFLKYKARADDPNMKNVYSHFQENLSEICRTGLRSRAKVIVCTVPTNLKDCPPFASMHRQDLTATEKEKWDNLYKEGAELQTGLKTQDAVQRFLEAAEIDGSFADLSFRLGQCYWQLGRYDEAYREYVVARDLDALRFRTDTKLNEIIRKEASDREDKGLFLVDAEQSFVHESMHGIPGEDWFYEHVHMTHQGNYVLARAVFDSIDKNCAAVQKSPVLSMQESARRLALTGYDQYRILSSVIYLMKSPPFTNQMNHTEILGRLETSRTGLQHWSKMPDIKKAINEYQSVLKESDGDLTIRHNYGCILVQAGDPASALEQFRIVLQQMPHNYEVYVNMGTALAKSGKNDEAIAEYKTALRIQPRCMGFEACYNLAVLMNKQGKPKEAAEYYSEALRIDPTSLDVRTNLADTLVRLGKTGDAVSVLREGINRTPSEVSLQIQLGMLLFKSGKPGEATACLSEALRLNPDSAEIHNNLGAMFEELGDSKKALFHYLEALRVKPDMAEVHLNLAKLLSRQDKSDEAIIHYFTALKIKPGLPIAHNDLGVLLARQGRLKEAIPHFKEAIKLKQDFMEAYVNLTNALTDEGGADEAISYFQKVLTADPGLAEAHYSLGIVLYRHGDLEKAIDHLSKAVEIKPDMPGVRRSLEEAMVASGKNQGKVQR